MPKKNIIIQHGKQSKDAFFNNIIINYIRSFKRYIL